MISGRARTLLGGVAISATLLGAAPAHADRTTRLQSLLDQIVQRAAAPGGLMILDDGHRTWRGASGVADLRNNAPMRVGKRFRVASITKMFVATVVLQLAAEGQLGLDDPVDRWLPDGAGITVRQLLNHTSGLVGNYGRAPTGTFSYSNENYLMLGRIMEAVTGASVAAELDARIFRPLHLDHTVWPSTASVHGLAHGYSYGGGAEDVTRQAVSSLNASNALVSTPEDIRRFLGGLFGGALLRPAELAAMQTPVAIPPDHRAIYDGYGLGLMEIETPCGPMWGHRGRFTGYTSFAFASPDGRRAVVVMLNYGGVEGGISDALVARLQHLVASAYCLPTKGSAS
jgi:D-alanyl-D-alanine carboxypeptidase